MTGRGCMRISYPCPFCGYAHEVQVMEYQAKTVIKGEAVEYGNLVCRCDKAGKEFSPPKVQEESLFRAREAYKKKKGLLTAAEIKEIRDFYDLTQKEYARLLGVGDVTVQRYETKQIQDGIYDEAMRMTRKNPSWCLSLLEMHKADFSTEQYEKIRKTVVERIRQFGEEYFLKEMIRAKYAEFGVLSSKNGYCRLKLETLEAVLTYLAASIRPLYKEKLWKLLWYVDAEFYRQYKRAMTGLVYRRSAAGAVPIAGDEIIKLPGLRVSEKESGDSTVCRIFPNREVSLREFAFEELEVLQRIVKKFGNLETKALIKSIHAEAAFRNTGDHQIMEFSPETVIEDF